MEGFDSRISILAQEFVKENNNVTVLTSNSNHAVNYKKSDERIQNYVYNGVDFKILKTLQYKKSVSISRILSWFDFEFKLFFNFSRLVTKKPDVIIVSSLSLLTIINGLILKNRFKSTKIGSSFSNNKYFFHYLI